MPSLARVRSSADLDLWTGVPGICCAPQAVAYRVYDVSTDAKMLAPTQVYPAAVGSTYPDADVDLVADLIDTDHYKASGFMAWLATYAGTGRHRITWSYTFRAGDAKIGDSIYGPWFTPVNLVGLDDDAIVGPVEVSEEFDVIAGAVRLFGYCLPSDLRAEGLTTTDASDLRLALAIKIATQLVEKITGRHFEPRRKKLLLDGNASNHLTLDEAVIWLQQVALSSMFVGEPLEVNTTDVRVYNRHLLTGQTTPDDRHNPRIELLRYGTWTTQLPPATAFVRWPAGEQNIALTGLFGYTDPDPDGVSAVGVLPEMVRHACKLLVMREYEKLTAFDNREDRRNRHRLTGEGVQGYNYRVTEEKGDYYGVGAEIGLILATFQRPLEIGAA